ncbi:MAG: PH domain-containing protein [Methanothermobacter tenebrarum]|nr:PH domain-containing protein [Methanobacteriales archaeon]MBC7117751.1 PH domain-containing protein [Methanobacteriaceae archaeon]NPV64651.1 PH domain-containing protein [Methanobacteriaceae archaeon]
MKSGERIIYSTHPRLFLYSSSIILNLIVVVILFYILPFAMEAAAKLEYSIASAVRLPLAQIVTWIFLIIILALIIKSIIDLISWRFTKYILTDQRVIIEKGLIHKEMSYIYYDKIVDVVFSQSLLERLVSAGDIQIFGGHEHTPIILENAPNPQRIDKLINQLISGDYEMSKVSRDDKAPREESVLKRHSNKFKRLK